MELTRQVNSLLPSASRSRNHSIFVFVGLHFSASQGDCRIVSLSNMYFISEINLLQELFSLIFKLVGLEGFEPPILRLKVGCLRLAPPLGYRPNLEEGDRIELSPYRYDGPGFKPGCTPCAPPSESGGEGEI